MVDGRITTFYSYKGGVGRTFALANVGALLAARGRRVLCVDWDLEAPGLGLYFSRDKAWMPDPPTDGLVDVVEGFGESGVLEWERRLTRIQLPAATGSLDFLSAGDAGDRYFDRMQALDWQALYAERDLGAALEAVRDEWRERYDDVLIDSRTGVTDIGGICTVQLPDSLVMLGTANRQSLEGLIRVARLAQEQRDKLPYDRAQLIAVPVLSRFEARVEYHEAQHWLDRYSIAFEPLLRRWLPTGMTPRQLLNHARIPHIAYWSFGERLPVVEQPADIDDPESIGFAFETLATLVAHRFREADRLLAERERYVAEVSGPRRLPLKFVPIDVRVEVADRGAPLTTGNYTLTIEPTALRAVGVEIVLDEAGYPNEGADLDVSIPREHLVGAEWTWRWSTLAISLKYLDPNGVVDRFATRFEADTYELRHLSRMLQARYGFELGEPPDTPPGPLPRE